MRHSLLGLSALFILGTNAFGGTLPEKVEVSASCAPLNIRVYSRPGYTLNPGATMAPYIALSEKLTDYLVNSPADTYIVEVKPPWPLSCQNRWVKQLVRQNNADAIRTGLANAARKGYHLDVVPNVVFCNDHPVNLGTTYGVTIACHDGAVRVRSRLESSGDLQGVLDAMKNQGMLKD